MQRLNVELVAVDPRWDAAISVVIAPVHLPKMNPNARQNVVHVAHVKDQAAKSNQVVSFLFLRVVLQQDLKPKLYRLSHSGYVHETEHLKPEIFQSLSHEKLWQS